MTLPLSVVIPTRDGDIQRVLDAVVPQVEDVGGEVVVVDGRGDLANGGGGRRTDAAGVVQWMTVPDQRMPALRLVGLLVSRGDVVAIGEDHAVPAPAWSRAVIDAHARHEHADAVVGCLINGTDRTRSGRANFFAFASPWARPMHAAPRRPPPASTLSLKRRALDRLGHDPGAFDSVLRPALFVEGRMVADDSVAVFHYQDHGIAWSVVNAYAAARSGYGSAPPITGNAARRRHAWSTLLDVPRQLWSEARSGPGRSAPVLDRAAVAAIACGAGVGAALGALRGPGRAPDRVA